MERYKFEKSEREWREKLNPEQYRILREKGTEPAFSGCYWNHKGLGQYHCAACGYSLFSSKTKYESGSGWPSFWQPIDEMRIDKETDSSHGMMRIEVLCRGCGSHLGHVFNDGPAPTGQRYCINSASLTFQEET